MKRHISIFAFLLCAFAASGPLVSLDAQANITMKGWGIYKPGSDALTQDSQYFSPPSATITYNSVPYPVNLAKIDPGWTVVHWLVCEDKNPNNYSTWTELEGTEGLTQYVFTDKDKAAETSVATLAVKFRWITYNVTYDTVGGSPEPQSKSCGYDESFALPGAPQRTGYTFNGWRSSPRDGTFDAGATVSGSSLCPDTWHEDGNTVTLTAQWTTHRYSIACDLDNGAWPTGYDAPPSSASYGQVFPLPAPQRVGYDFVGWKVTSGLNATTAKWGTDEAPSQAISADTPCVNGDREVYFKNLNPTDGAAVTLSAQWQAKQVTVTFNNTGGSSGGGLLDTLPVTYGAAYPAVNAPTKGGSLFRGYEIDGILYWDLAGQPTRVAWDIPTNCTARAQWEEQVYHLTYNENKPSGTVSKTEVRDFVYGVPTDLYDGADFAYLGCTLLGWSTDPNATTPSYEPGGTATFTESKTLYAVWEQNYFIVYDGNGATNESPMAVQKFVFRKANQSLNPNTYGKVGYSFLGWATNRVAAERLDFQYRDRQVLQKDPATTLGETNTLYAAWGTNTYVIAFDPNGGSGTPMEPLKDCPYDTAVTLPDCTYQNGAYDFAGWSNGVEKVIYADLEVPVSNLCAAANGTNTLYAVWRLSDLSAAMGCDNLRWFSPSSKDAAWSTPSGKWSPGTLDLKGVIVSCVTNCGSSFDTLQSDALTKGTLRFSWHSTGGQMAVLVYGGSPNSPPGQGSQPLVSTDADGLAEIAIDPAEIPGGPYDSAFVVILHNKDGICSIHDMTWTPEGGEPKYADEDAKVTEFSMADGKLNFSFDSDGSSTYHILGTNDVTAPWPWPFVREIGADETQPVQIDIQADEPKMFYRIRALIP